jgi:magnesium-transporting ATPase (P-type)
MLIFALAFRLTGDTAHEWCGIILSIFFIIHKTVNWPWYKTLFKRKFNPRHIINITINLLLLTSMTALLISGILLSQIVFAFMNFSGGISIRQIHTLSAYWGLILISIHLGFHWDIIINAIRKLFKITHYSRFRKIIMQSFTFLLFTAGMWASFDRKMGDKLFLGYSFDFWPQNRPIILFLVENIFIMAMYTSITHYCLKLLKKFSKV